MLKSFVEVCVLDDGLNYLDGKLLVRHKQGDRCKGDGALESHKAFADTMVREFRGFSEKCLHDLDGEEGLAPSLMSIHHHLGFFFLSYLSWGDGRPTRLGSDCCSLLHL